MVARHSHLYSKYATHVKRGLELQQLGTGLIFTRLQNFRSEGVRDKLDGYHLNSPTGISMVEVNGKRLKGMIRQVYCGLWLLDNPLR
jgi:hypothetical protein